MAPNDTTSGPPDSTRLRRWWQEHSELDRLVTDLQDELGCGNASTSGAGAALERLADALATHLSVEEEVYFPLVERLSGEHAGTTRKARLVHKDLSADLNLIREHIAEQNLDAAGIALATLLERFRSHEQMESRMIEDLTAQRPERY